MQTIIGIAGSLRTGSYNLALLEAARRAAPDGCRIEVASLRGIPLYDADLEAADGVPEVVQSLKERIAKADGLLISTPEYNASLPGVLKNAIDWLSRPPADIARVFRDRPVALIGASAGGFGTVLSQTAWLPVLRALRARSYFGPPVRLARAGDAFDLEGRLKDADQAAQLADFVAGFSTFIGQPDGGP